MDRNQQPSAGSGWIPGLLIFGFALSIRLYVQNDLSDNPSFLYPLVDAGSHHNLALELQDSNTIPASLFWRSVFYPLYLGATYFTTGSSIHAAKLLQALLGALTCVLSFQLARRYFGPPSGLIAGLLTALYGPLIFWESELLAVGWAAFWSLALLWLVDRANETGSKGLHFAFGLVGAVAVLTRPSFLPFVLLAIGWLAWSARSPGSSNALSRLLIASVAFLLVVVPTAWTSEQVANHASFLPRAGALNLYLGNHPDRCELLAKRPGDEWMELRALTANVPDANAELRRLVFDYASSQPLEFAAGILHKFGQLANGREIPRNLDIYLFHEWSPLLGALVWKTGSFGFPFGLLLPLAALGLVLRRRDLPKPLLLLVATYPLVIAATFVAGRYRVPIVPALSILAAAGLVEISARLRRRDWRGALVPVALGAVLLVLCNRAEPYCEESGRFEAEMYAFVAMDAAQAGNRDLALELFQKAVEVDPQSSRAQEELAQHYAGQGELDLAMEHYTQALQLSQDHWVLLARGVVHFRLGDFDLALEDLDRAIVLSPESSPAHLWRGRSHLRLGNKLEAGNNVRAALRYAKSDSEVAAARQTQRAIHKRGRN